MLLGLVVIGSGREKLLFEPRNTLNTRNGLGSCSWELESGVMELGARKEREGVLELGVKS